MLSAIAGSAPEVGASAGIARDRHRPIALSAAARTEAVDIARAAGYIELSARRDFQGIFLKEIAFPSHE